MSRIAYLTSEYPAPSHTFIRREIAALRRRGLTILPFSVRQSATVGEEVVPAILGSGWLRCAVRAARMLVSSPLRSFSTWLLAQKHRVPGLRGLLWAQFHFVEALVLARMLRQIRAARLHTHFANSGATVGLLAAHHLRIPWSLTLHGISETDPPAGQLLRDKLLRADFVACASWFMRAQAMRLVPPAVWPKMHVVRCGVELSEFNPRKPDRGGDPPEFVSVGRLSAEKGFSGLIEALDGLIHAGVDANLLIVGDGPLRGTLDQQISKAGLNDRVRLLGALPEADTLAAIKNADFFVLASFMEGLPVVLLEAMALGTPVIAPAVAGIPEVVSDGESGLLFRPGDWAHLAQRMRLLIEDGELSVKVALPAHRKIEEEFLVDAAISGLAGLLSNPAK